MSMGCFDEEHHRRYMIVFYICIIFMLAHHNSGVTAVQWRTYKIDRCAKQALIV